MDIALILQFLLLLLDVMIDLGLLRQSLEHLPLRAPGGLKSFGLHLRAVAFLKAIVHHVSVGQVRQARIDQKLLGRHAAYGRPLWLLRHANPNVLLRHFKL